MVLDHRVCWSGVWYMPFTVHLNLLHEDILTKPSYVLYRGEQRSASSDWRIGRKCDFRDHVCVLVRRILLFCKYPPGQ
jgi:hypothetical protein